MSRPLPPIPKAILSATPGPWQILFLGSLVSAALALGNEGFLWTGLPHFWSVLGRLGLGTGLISLTLHWLTRSAGEQPTIFQGIADHAQDGICVFHRTRGVVYANRACVRLSAYPLDALQGRDIFDLFPTEAHARLQNRLDALAQSGQTKGIWLVRQADGGTLPVEIRATRLQGGLFLAVVRDISRRTESRRRLHAKRHLLEALMNALPDPLWLKDSQGHFRFANQAFHRLLGHPDQRFPDGPGETLRRMESEALTQGRECTHEVELPDQAGTPRVFEVVAAAVAAPLPGSFGFIPGQPGVLCIARNMDNMRAARSALAESEARYRTLVEGACDPIFIMNTQGDFLFVNRQACLSLGYGRDELLSMNVLDIEEEWDLPRLQAQWQAITPNEGAIGLGTQRRRNGERFPVEVRVTCIDWEGERRIITSVRDISERETTLQALRRSEAFSRAVLDATTAKIAVTDGSGRIVAVNAAWQRHALGANLPNGTPLSLEPEGPLAPASVTASSKSQSWRQEALEGVRQVLAHGREKYSRECPCNAVDGGEDWFLMSVTPLGSEPGGAVISFQDITHLHRAQALEEQALKQIKALATKQISIQEEERLAISRELHDEIGQSLAALRFSLAALRLERPGDDTPPTNLMQAEALVDRLVDDVRHLSRRLRPPQLDDLGLASALRWHLRQIPRPITLRIRLEENIQDRRFPPEVELAAFRVAQEGLSNALRHAAASEVVVALSLGTNTLQVSVADDGRGFHPQGMLDSGTATNSLGLIGMRERVAALQGDFTIVSEIGQGTEVIATFGQISSE